MFYIGFTGWQIALEKEFLGGRDANWVSSSEDHNNINKTAIKSVE